MDTTKFNKVTPDNFSRLKTYLQQNGCSGLDGNEGRAVANCLKLGYKYDPEAGILALEAEALPENLQALPDHIRVAAGHRLLANVMGLNRPGTMILPTFTSNPPYPYRPSLYGVYNYVNPYVMNWSCHPFTFKSQSLTNGTLSYYLPVIPYNLNEAFRLFSAQSVKLSGTGVGGSVDYIWRDNATIMTISFFLNTVFTSTFTIGFSTNTLVFNAENTDAVSDGYTYLDPIFSISKAPSSAS
jgi:hypothetical protein